MFEGWYDAWGNLYESVRTGKPVVQKPHDQSDEATRTYIMGMYYRGVGQAKLLSKTLSLKGKKRLLGVAGGPGVFPIWFAKKNRSLRATVLDLPQTLKITREVIQDHKLGDRVSTQTGNYLTDASFGSDYDVVLLSSMLNQEPPSTLKDIMRKSLEALNPGGWLIVQDQFLNDAKTGPSLSALIGVNQLIHTPGGSSHSAKEAGEWMKEVGFSKVQRVPLGEESPFTVLRGIKP